MDGWPTSLLVLPVLPESFRIGSLDNRVEAR